MEILHSLLVKEIFLSMKWKYLCLKPAKISFALSLKYNILTIFPCCFLLKNSLYKSLVTSLY